MITRHLKENNISYFEHMARALKISILSLKISVAMIVHAILPFIFEKYASDTALILSKELDIKVSE